MANALEQAVASGDPAAINNAIESMVAGLPSEALKNQVRNQLKQGISEIKSIQPSQAEQDLLNQVTQAGSNELTRLSNGTLFQLDPATAAALDKIKATGIASAKDTLNYGLEQATSTATAGAAGRGLPRGSLRAELTARLQGPVLERFQQQIAGIEASDANARINIPRGDVGIRQSVINSPALTALQRNRLQQAELKMRLTQMQEARAERQRARSGGVGSAVGTIVGGAVGLIGGPAGAAAGAKIGGSLGSGDVSGALQSGLNYWDSQSSGSDSGTIIQNDLAGGLA